MFKQQLGGQYDRSKASVGSKWEKMRVGRWLIRSGGTLQATGRLWHLLPGRWEPWRILRDVTRLGCSQAPPGCRGGGQTFLAELVGATLSSLPSRQRQFPGLTLPGLTRDLFHPPRHATLCLAVMPLPSSWKSHFTNGNKKATAIWAQRL